MRAGCVIGLLVFILGVFFFFLGYDGFSDIFMM